MPHKITITIRIIFIIIIALCLIALAYCSYDNLDNVRKSTSDYDKGVNKVISDWLKADSETTEMLKQTKKNLADSEARIDKLIKEAEEIIND